MGMVPEWCYTPCNDKKGGAKVSPLIHHPQVIQSYKFFEISPDDKNQGIFLFAISGK